MFERFSIFRKKGLSYQERKRNDFETARQLDLTGTKLSDRDKQLIALGRTDVHKENYNHYRYKTFSIKRKPKEFKAATENHEETVASKNNKKTKKTS